jgi:hypothetical protein
MIFNPPDRQFPNPRSGMLPEENQKGEIMKLRKLLVILVVMTAATGANAAKLCRKNAFSGIDSVAYNNNIGIWAAGIGCGQNTYGVTTGNKTSVTNPADLCATWVISGVGLCDSPDFTYLGKDDFTVGAVQNVQGGVCFCKTTWPFESHWIPIMVARESGCAGNCLARCGLQRLDAVNDSYMAKF